jgi:hypothetical protein
MPHHIGLSCRLEITCEQLQFAPVSLHSLGIEILLIGMQQYAQSSCGHARVMDGGRGYRGVERGRGLVQAPVQDLHLTPQSDAQARAVEILQLVQDEHLPSCISLNRVILLGAQSPSSDSTF